MNSFGVVLLIAIISIASIVSNIDGLTKPNINVSPSSPKEGDNITLACLGNFTQENVSYHWLYNDDVVDDEDQAVWFLQHAGRQKRGSYSCQVTNDSNVTKTSDIKNVTILYMLHAPGDLKVVPVNSTALHVSWSAPSSRDEAQKPISYNIYYRRKSFPFVVVNVREDEYTIPNLLPATKYEVKVSAVNINGEGVNSTGIENRTSDGKASKMLNLTAIGLSQAIELSWQEPESTNGNITGFYICNNQTFVDGFKSLRDTQCVTTSNIVGYYLLDKLGKYSTYDISVSAVNSAGNGELAIVRNVTTREEIPTDVRNFSAVPSYYNINVSWSTPLHMNGVFRGYNVTYIDNDGRFSEACIDTEKLHCFIDHLPPGKLFAIEVTVSNSLFSTSKNRRVQTLHVSVPAEYRGLLDSPTNIRSNSFTIKLITFQGPIMFYDVIVKELGTTASLPARKPANFTNEEIKVGTSGLYVAGRIFDPKKWGHEFVVGEYVNYTEKSNISSLAIPNNKQLKEGTFYSLFVRGYASNRVHQSTLWYPSVKTAGGPQSKLGVGAIAGIAVCGILFAGFSMGVLYMIVVRWYKKKETKKKESSVVTHRLSLGRIKNVTIGGADDPRVPVKVEDFPEHVFQLKGNSNYRFTQQYSLISRDLDKPYNYSRQLENNPKNRYHNVPAYDETRVVLEVIDDDPNSDYINANFINGFANDKEYIATQGPLPETAFDFWRMAWENDVSTIIMLTKLEERGRLKCARYWPDDHAIFIKDFVITPTDVHEFPDHITRTFHLTRTGQAVEKMVRQFHFVAWPDFGVPDDPSALLCFIGKVNKW